jgi:UTP:GlnB (protein PII) uridylyltransferase
MNVLEGKPEEAVYEARAFDNLGKSLLEDLGPDFRSGRYKNTVHYWISALSKVHQNGEPIVQPFSHQDNFLGVACRDYPGLLTVITGQLYKSGTDLLQAHAYSLTKHGLVLDMFEYHPTNEGKDLSDRIKLLIAKKTMIDDDPMEILSRASKKEARLNSHSVDSSTNHYSLEFTAENNVPGIVYALTRILYGSANAHIYGVNAYAYPGKPVSNSIFFSSPLPSHSVGEVVNQKINL